MNLRLGNSFLNHVIKGLGFPFAGYVDIEKEFVW